MKFSRTALGPWVPRELLGAVHRLRGDRGKRAGPVPAIAAVLAAPPAGPASDAPPLVPFTRSRPDARAVLVAVFGLGPAELDRVVDLVDGQCAAAGVVPVFLTDDDDFLPFRRRRLAFEYLPPPPDGARSAPDLDWDLYRQRRLALLRRKWRPVRVIAFGPAASAALAAWRDSPFEDPGIAELIVTGNGPAAGLR